MLYGSSDRPAHQMSQATNEFGLRDLHMFKILITGTAYGIIRAGVHLCPVCGYGLPKPAEDFTICPSCGVEFGYSDVGVSHRELRIEWITFGAPWSSVVVPRPYAWNPWDQLIQAGLSYDVPWAEHPFISECKPATSTGAYYSDQAMSMATY
jgi:hypothetical protein